jgi:hypothetical protein
LAFTVIFTASSDIVEYSLSSYKRCRQNNKTHQHPHATAPYHRITHIFAVAVVFSLGSFNCCFVFAIAAAGCRCLSFCLSSHTCEVSIGCPFEPDRANKKLLERGTNGSSSKCPIDGSASRAFGAQSGRAGSDAEDGVQVGQAVAGISALRAPGPGDMLHLDINRTRPSKQLPSLFSRTAQTQPPTKSNDHLHLIHIAPPPALPRLNRPHNRMLGLMKVFGRMLMRRRIATPHMSALQTHPQMHPATMNLQALLTPLRRRLHPPYLIHMRTLHTLTPRKDSMPNPKIAASNR